MGPFHSYTCVYIWMCVCVCVYTHIYTHIHTWMKAFFSGESQLLICHPRLTWQETPSARPDLVRNLAAVPQPRVCSWASLVAALRTSVVHRTGPRGRDVSHGSPSTSSVSVSPVLRETMPLKWLHFEIWVSSLLLPPRTPRLYSHYLLWTPLPVLTLLLSASFSETVCTPDTLK